MYPIRNSNRAVLVLAASLLSAVAITALGSSLALAVDTVTSKDAPDLTSVRAKIKAKDYQAALAELKTLADTHQHADVYSLMGFSLRKTGDYPTALAACEGDGYLSVFPQDWLVNIGTEDDIHLSGDIVFAKVPC